MLETARTHFGTATTLDCACRCPAHNKEVGGEDYSQPLYGMAADIKVSGYSPDVVADYFESQYPNKYGIGRYNIFTLTGSSTNTAIYRSLINVCTAGPHAKA